MDADGTFRAFRGRFIGNSSAYAVVPVVRMVGPACAALIPSIYDVRNASWSRTPCLTNKCPTGAVRGVGWTGQLIPGVLIEDVAGRRDRSVLELRVKNAIGPEAVTALGARYDGGSYVESMRVWRRRRSTTRTPAAAAGAPRAGPLSRHQVPARSLEPPGSRREAHQVSYPITSTTRRR
ncbi:molybdopterin-dependent oxidoreductase [Pseudonocardia sp. MCCB 268]|nr:molybdopterin-dependent oxidoreductase [Pseudonocardia cytotoxica]